jgi:hypothetical protein
MSLKSTKAQLVQLLSDADNKVIALSGKWGTGKSHMWEEVKTSAKHETIRSAIYASLFGLSSIDQVKLRLLQNAIPTAEKNPKVWESAKVGIQSTIKVLQGVHSSFGALNDIGLIVAPAMLQDRLIVLDDIERKHQNLHIDEVLGFIDEFTQQRGSRFVLILNSDKLDKLEVWDTLREKVVDQELCLKTTPTEAFDIALQLTPSRYADQIRTSVEACGLTNIRIAQKVIKAVNQVLGDHQKLPKEVLTRVIPSTVLLAAIHYKGIEDGPDFDFVLGQGTPSGWDGNSTKKVDDTEDGKRKSKWKILLQQLQVLGCDEFEVLIIEFLQSGLFEGKKVSEIIDRYILEEDQLKARDDFNKFFEQLTWEHTRSEAELLAEATLMASRVQSLDAGTITYFHGRVSALPGGQIVADGALTKWIEAFKAKSPDSAPEEGLFHRELHPRIKEEFQAINAKNEKTLTPFDVCAHVAKHSGWGVRQELAMKSATVQDMDSLIRTLPIPNLKLFMRCMLDYALHKETYEKHFGSAMDNFVEACRGISRDQTSGRLGKLIIGLFAESGRPGLLDPTQDAGAKKP